MFGTSRQGYSRDLRPYIPNTVCLISIYDPHVTDDSEYRIRDEMTVVSDRSRSVIVNSTRHGRAELFARSAIPYSLHLYTTPTVGSEDG